MSTVGGISDYRPSNSIVTVLAVIKTQAACPRKRPSVRADRYYYGCAEQRNFSCEGTQPGSFILSFSPLAVLTRLSLRHPCDTSCFSHWPTQAEASRSQTNRVPASRKNRKGRLALLCPSRRCVRGLSSRAVFRFRCSKKAKAKLTNLARRKFSSTLLPTFNISTSTSGYDLLHVFRFLLIFQSAGEEK